MEIKSNLWVAGTREDLKEAISCGLVKVSEPLLVPDLSIWMLVGTAYLTLLRLGFLKTREKLQPKQAIDEHLIWQVYGWANSLHN